MCGYSQLPSDEAKRRHNANSLCMKLMMLESTNRHPFFGGDVSISEISAALNQQCPSHRERAASKEFRSISIPGRVTSQALRLLHCFCDVAEDRSCFTLRPPMEVSDMIYFPFHLADFWVPCLFSGVLLTSLPILEEFLDHDFIKLMCMQFCGQKKHRFTPTK